MKLIVVFFLLTSLYGYTQKDVEHSMKYYYKVVNQKNLNENERLAVLIKILDKYKGRNLDLSKVKREIEVILVGEVKNYNRIKQKMKTEERINILKNLIKKYEKIADVSELKKELVELESVKEKPTTQVEVKPVTVEKEKVPVIDVNQKINVESEDAEIVRDEEYTVECGDILSILVTPAEELSRDVIVNPDGTITFPFVGSLIVKGKKISVIKSLLTERLSRYIVSPKVDIVIKYFAKEKVLVIGEVRSPGVYGYVKDMDVFDLVTFAGGFTDVADKKNIKIYRGKLPDKEIITVDIEEVIKTGVLSKDFKLYPGDTVKIDKVPKLISVIGEVKHIGGRFELLHSETLTVSKAISMVGGPAPDADLTRVRILRENPNEIVHVNVAKVYKGDFKSDILLKSGDVVYVPRKPMVSALYYLSQITPWLTTLALILTLKVALGI